LNNLSGLDVGVNQSYQELIDGSTTKSISNELDPVLESIGNGSNPELEASAKSAYRSILGFYNGKLSKLGHPGVDRLISFVNNFSKQTGLKELPEIEMQTVRKMGLQTHAGLNVVNKSSDRKESGRGGRGGGRGGYSAGRGGRGGRGNGMLIDTRGSSVGGGARYMSTDARNGSLPMKRTNSSGDSTSAVESKVVNSPKKSRSGRAVSRNKGRQPTGRGA
jgi:hypothetical protein